MKYIASILEHLFTHWKTSLLAFMVAVITVCLGIKWISVTQWLEGMGVVASIYLMLSRDHNKQDNG